MADKNIASLPVETTMSGSQVFLATDTLTSASFLISLDDATELIIGTNVDITDFDKLASVTASASEINNLNGYTGNTADLNAIAGIGALGVTPTVLGYLTGSTGNIQTQINNKASLNSFNNRPYQYNENFILGGATTTAKITNTDIFAGIGLAAASYYIPANTIKLSVWKQASATSATEDKTAVTQINSAVIGATSTYQLTQINLSSLTVSTTYDIYINFKVVAK